ncbi:zinc finger protein CONSTANS-LIKE 1-like [Iris pallida]|uniref:Zinc finger protein CONSTANS-LIKE 1-like n=1 Tax=Iris pallida TaxID=29817 RepID=A0AAX6F7D3_IRIPA|nr:zinc finger protein CONSTANS-LIKE 1-like [Iris pallida]
MKKSQHAVWFPSLSHSLDLYLVFHQQKYEKHLVTLESHPKN